MKLTKNQLSNLLAFLERVEVKGFNEISAMVELIQILQEEKDKVEN